MTSAAAPFALCPPYRRWRVGRFASGQQRRRPLFVLGTQKTGSTAIAALLASATKQTVTLDLIRAFKDPEWQLRVKNGTESFDSVAYRYRREFKRQIVKEPVLTYFADELRQLYPQANFVMIVRHPLDTVRSVLSRLQVPGDLPHLYLDQHPELVRAPAWQLAMDSSWLGRPSTHYIDALAHRWDLAAREYLANESDYALIKYEDFRANRQERIEQLAQQLGMTVTHDIKDELNVQYQPKGHSVDFDTFFGRANLERIRDICTDSADALKYAF